jgi:carboxypeptidase T
MFKKMLLAATVVTSMVSFADDDETVYTMRVPAKDKFERTKITEMGVSIERVEDGYVWVMGHKKHVEQLRKLNKLETAFRADIEKLDYPVKDEQFHNYEEMNQKLRDLAAAHPEILTLSEFGKSLEGKVITMATITGGETNALEKPAIFFVGGHHAREHVSVEMPLMLIEHLVTEYAKGNKSITRLVDNRTIYVVPELNPDGSEHDIASGRYKSWRKNRRPNANGTYGVDLNRNYGHRWGTVGSSSDPSSDVYHGTGPFSEPETQAVKSFMETHTNVTTVLSFHTFSELILYPWGYTYDSIANERDLRVHQTMANKMAQWNGYTPQQSSDLYTTSGDTTDWAYAEHGVISFTFELDPKSMWEGGFYPGQSAIQRVFQKNLQPSLYLIEYADNPFRTIEGTSADYGLSTPILN